MFGVRTLMNKRQAVKAVYDEDANGAFPLIDFATHSIAHHRNVVKNDADVDLSLLGPLGCGIQTGAGVAHGRRRPVGAAGLRRGQRRHVGDHVRANCRMQQDNRGRYERGTARAGEGVGRDPRCRGRRGLDAEKVRGIVEEGVDFAIECSGNAKAARAHGRPGQAPHLVGRRRLPERITVSMPTNKSADARLSAA